MGYNDLVQVLRQLIFDILEEKRDYRHGLLGDGEGNVAVDGVADYVYVRENKNSSKVMQILNKRVDGADGTPVLYGELPWQPGVIQVVSIDWDAYSRSNGWGGDSYTGVPIHHRAHQYPSEAERGSDAVLVYQPALQMLKTTAGGGTTLDVAGCIYSSDGDYVSFGGTNIDVASLIPPAGYKNYVLISLNTASNIIRVTAGSDVPDVGAVQPVMPSIPSGDIASAYVLLTGGTTTIQDTEIVDVRNFFGTASGGLSYITNNGGLILVNNNGTIISA